MNVQRNPIGAKAMSGPFIRAMTSSAPTWTAQTSPADPYLGLRCRGRHLSRWRKDRLHLYARWRCRSLPHEHERHGGEKAYSAKGLRRWPVLFLGWPVYRLPSLLSED